MASSSFSRLGCLILGSVGLLLLASCSTNVDYQAHRNLQAQWSADAKGIRKPVSALKGTYQNTNEKEKQLWHVFGGDPRSKGQAVRLEPVSPKQLRVTLLKDGREVDTAKANLEIIEGGWSTGSMVSWGGSPIAYGTNDEKAYLRLDAKRNLELAWSSNGVVHYFGGAAGSMRYRRTLERRGVHRRIGD